MRKPCIDCGTPTEHSPCPACRHRRHQAYGSRYQKRRAVALHGATHCETCGVAFTPSNPATGGHSVPIRRGGAESRIAAQCRRCNYGWQATDL